MKVQVKKVGVVPRPFPPISMSVDLEQVSYSRLDLNAMYVCKFEVATQFTCPEELLGEVVETTILPNLKSFMYKELEDILQELRVHTYEGNQRAALDSVSKLSRLIHEGPEIEYIR
jgi:hypothetical protein